jgi:hypothetical protein
VMGGVGVVVVVRQVRRELEGKVFGAAVDVVGEDPGEASAALTSILGRAPSLRAVHGERVRKLLQDCT